MKSSAVTLEVATARLRARLDNSAAAKPLSSANFGSPKLANRAKAAVLVPLFEEEEGGDGLSVWLTKRSEVNVSTHKGEVSLPGGKGEEDEDCYQTAVREAREEVGIGEEHVNLIGCLPPVLSKHGLVVSPVVATLTKEAPEPRVQTPETEVVFKVPLSIFNRECDRARHRSKLYSWNTTPYTLHFFDYEDDAGQAHTIWGLTAYILIEVAEIVYGAKPYFPKHVNASKY
ncbi:Nudix hydrolase [Chloropicon primus]|uniref:Nudix hydrolase n=1 Tax=Chloropicon primus TaxID=1764295 RepID=A0A5B8MTU8_9CHLO|nr:Nudix hydrolase [Chloropicon primus]UPR03024.1 Nudix hydrolase [Chloropicon primus]|eukprot:QDZ23811.1 Nudix hydrolase [Chloropicon primus]